MNALIKINPDDYGIEESRALNIQKSFQPAIEAIAEAEERCAMVKAEADKEITQEICDLAREQRLILVTMRGKADKIRIKEKAQYKLATDAIDGFGKVIKYAISKPEEEMRAIEDHFANIEKERKDKLATDRMDQLEKYPETSAYGMNLGTMTDDMWEIVIAGAEAKHNKALQAEKDAEAARIKRAEELDAERVAKQEEINALKKKAAAQEVIDARAREEEKKAQILRDERAAEEASKRRIEKEKADAKAAEKEKELQALRDKAAAQQKKIDDDIAAKRRAEQEEFDRKDRERRELEGADDDVKLKAFMDKLRTFYKEAPELNNKVTQQKILEGINAIAAICNGA